MPTNVIGPLESEANDDSRTELNQARRHPFAEEIACVAPYARRLPTDTLGGISCQREEDAIATHLETGATEGSGR